MCTPATHPDANEAAELVYIYIPENRSGWSDGLVGSVCWQLLPAPTEHCCSTPTEHSDSSEDGTLHVPTCGTSVVGDFWSGRSSTAPGGSLPFLPFASLAHVREEGRRGGREREKEGEEEAQKKEVRRSLYIQTPDRPPTRLLCY